jgi:hypothetical protein
MTPTPTPTPLWVIQPLPDVVVAMEVVTSLAAFVGLAIGIIVGLNGFAQPANESSRAAEIPRLKNLLWLVSGFAALIIADPKKLWLPDNFPMFWPCMAYGFGSMIGLVIAIGGTLRSITSSVNFFNESQLREVRLDPANLRSEYIHYGKARFNEQFQKAKELAEKRAEELRLRPEVGKMIVDCTYSTIGYLAHPAAERTTEVANLQIDVIMKAMCAAVRAYGSRLPEIRASYMEYVQIDAVDDVLRPQLEFTTGMSENYSGYLKLRLGGGVQLREVVLPVAKENSHVLPGAPEALLQIGIAIMNLSEITFQSGVSLQVQNEIRNFFRDNYFLNIASVTSLEIVSPERIRGVINLESTETNLLGMGPEGVKAMAERLRPLCALLSVI